MNKECTFLARKRKKQFFYLALSMQFHQNPPIYHQLHLLNLFMVLFKHLDSARHKDSARVG